MGKRFYVLPAVEVLGLRSFSFEEAIKRADEQIDTDGIPRVIVGFEAEIVGKSPQPITTHTHGEKTS